MEDVDKRYPARVTAANFKFSFFSRLPILLYLSSIQPKDSSIERTEVARKISRIDTATSRAFRSSASSRRGVHLQ
jgi:hypothetical protein